MFLVVQWKVQPTLLHFKAPFRVLESTRGDDPNGGDDIKVGWDTYSSSLGASTDDD